MRKYIFTIILLLTIFLTACAPANPNDANYQIPSAKELTQSEDIDVDILKSFEYSEYSGGVDVFFFRNLTISGFDRCYVVVGTDSVAIDCLGDTQ